MHVSSWNIHQLLSVNTVIFTCMYALQSCAIVIIEDVISMALTEAKQKANQKYRNKFVYLQTRTTDEYRSTIYEHIEKTGESLNTFILRAIAETMERDSNL